MQLLGALNLKSLWGTLEKEQNTQATLFKFYLKKRRTPALLPHLPPLTYPTGSSSVKTVAAGKLKLPITSMSR